MKATVIHLVIAFDHAMDQSMTMKRILERIEESGVVHARVIRARDVQTPARSLDEVLDGEMPE
jgi:hypothetical protein